jgi:tRNA threonylcarbamoyladenosine biosynthesis protein TsaE
LSGPSRQRSSSSAETEEVGARLAGELGPGDVVLVAGELGAGKTTLIRGACRALGVTAKVNSPTFTLGRRYEGRVPISHLDLYRLDDLPAEEPGLLDEYLTPDAVSFVEWPGDALPTQALGDDKGPRVAITVTIDHAGGDNREIEVSDARSSL